MMIEDGYGSMGGVVRGQWGFGFSSLRVRRQWLFFGEGSRYIGITTTDDKRPFTRLVQIKTEPLSYIFLSMRPTEAIASTKSTMFKSYT